MTTSTTPDTVRSTPSTAPHSAGTQFPLSWLRGIAALSVLMFHAYQHQRTEPDWQWPFSGGLHQLMTGTDLLVDMFFVLSGVVLWLPIARAAEQGRAGRSGRVLLYRRMARLLPLYLVVVLVVWALSNPTFPGNWQDLVLHLTFTHVYSDTYIFWTDGPAWSLAVEFHFYVVMALAVPVVNAALRRVSTRRARLAVASVLPALCVVAGAGYLLWATVIDPQDPENWSVWFSPLSRAADFGLGMGLALLSAAGVRLGGRVRAGLAVSGLAALVALVLVRPESVIGAWWHPAYALALTIGLASIVLHDGPWPRALSWKPLTWVGGLGYGIYLVHEPVMRVLDSWGALPAPRMGPWFVVTGVLVAIPAVALAWVSSKTIEAAGLRMLATVRHDGAARDYYDHLADEQAENYSTSGVDAGSTARATASRTPSEPA